MINKYRHILARQDQQEWLLGGFSALTLSCIFAAMAGEWYFMLGLPAFVLLAYLAIVDFRMVYYLLLACIPLSTEFYLPNGIGTDLPTEPLMVGLMLVGGLYFIRHFASFGARFLRHPITLLLLAHLAWIFISTLTSDLLFVSVKFTLAKTWYIVVFFFLTGWLVRTVDDVRRIFWIIFWPLLFTIAIAMARHAAYGFSFADVYKVLSPFYRNHVNYAAIMALFMPWIWFVRWWYPRWSTKWILLSGSMLFLLVAIYFSYTRAAYAAIIIAAGTYFVVQFRLMRPLLLAAAVGAALGLSYMIRNNNYLEFAPNYDRTISHQDFDNLLAATYKMEDISTMERVYRWVAGFHMVNANPWFGFGPGNFVNFYRSYTVTSFQTYVSDNEEQSGIHSYFLMTLVEQGIVGLLLFLALNFYVLIKGEQIYHQETDPRRRHVIMLALLCIVVITAFQLINDLLETDKIGTFWFICLALLVRFDRSYLKKS